MAGTPVIDLRDKSTPPPDDPERAPYGFRWDAKKNEWTAKRSAGGRPAGPGWFGKAKAPEPEPGEFTFDDEPSPVKVAEAVQDPAPAYATMPARKAPKTRKAPPRVSKKAKDDMTAAVGMIGMILLPPVVSADPYCGGAVADNLQQITDAVIPLLCKSATVVAFFSDAPGSDWMLWFKLMMALAPVGVAVGRHHILKTVEIQQDETGAMFVVERDLSQYATGEEAPSAADAS